MKHALNEALKRRKMSNQNGYPIEDGDAVEQKLEARKNDQAPDVADASAPDPMGGDPSKVQIDLNVKQPSSIMGDYNPSGSINEHEQESMQNSLSPDMNSFMNPNEEEELKRMIARGDKPKSLLQRAQMEQLASKK